MTTDHVLERIDLAEVIESLRDTLQRAQSQTEAGGPRVQFGVGPVQVTLTVAVTKTVSAGGEVGGKVRFWVLNADAKATASGTRTSVATQTIQLTLSPFDSTKPANPDGTPASVAITGESIPGEALPPSP